MMRNTEALLQRIEALPPERIAEVEDFVAFIASRELGRQIVPAAGVASERSFAEVWQNPEDDMYDAI